MGKARHAHFEIFRLLKEQRSELESIRARNKTLADKWSSMLDILLPIQATIL